LHFDFMEVTDPLHMPLQGGDITEMRLDLLGTCRLSLPGGGLVQLNGPRTQTAVALAALDGEGMTDAKMAAHLSRGRGGGETDEQAVRVLRARLPTELKESLANGSERWTFSDLKVDMIELKQEARELLKAGIDADGEALRRVITCLGQRFLPDIGSGSAGQTTWLVNKRLELDGLRLELLEAAIEWAEQRSDPWTSDLHETAARLRLRLDPAAQSERRVQGLVISNIWSADAVELIGRERDLRTLRERFGQGGRRQAIWGVAGVGKSSLAMAFVQRYPGEYRLRWRVDAESHVKMRESLRRLGRRLGIASAERDTSTAEDDPHAEQFFGDLADHLGSNLAGRWILIFDNVERPAILQPIWTQLPDNGHVLVTSQWQHWEEIGAKELHLWNLRLEDAVELLTRTSHRLPANDPDLKGICQTLECHPLLLKHAGMTMYADGIGPTEYLEHLHSGIDRAVRLWPELGITRRHAITTYSLAIEKAAAEESGAGPLIQIAAFMAPELVTESILRAGIVGCTPELADADAVTRARRELCNRSLIEDYQRTESFSMPAVTQAVVRISLSEEERHVRLLAAVRALKRALPAPDADDAFEQRLWLAPHIEAVVGQIEDRGDGRLRAEAAELASQLGLLRRSQAEWEVAEAAHKQAVDLSRDDPDRRAAALRAVRLASVMRHRMRFEDADVVMSSALPSLRAATAPDDVDVSYALTVQARILRRKPDASPVEAYDYLHEALAILDRRPDVDPGQLSRTLNYCAVLLRQLGRYQEAEEKSRRGFELIAKCEPERWMQEAPEPVGNRPLAVHLRSLGNLWRLLGRFEESCHANEWALKIFTRLYGDDHTDVGTCLDALGRTYRERGDFEVALEYFERARKIGERRFGADTANKAAAMANIALTLFEMESYEEALEPAEGAVELYCAIYGDDWEFGEDRGDVEWIGGLRNELTAWAVFVRARVWAALGRTRTARRDHREVLRLRKKLYGPADHPHIAFSLHCLGEIEGIEGQREAAIGLLEQARSMRARVGGESSYWVAQSDATLGELSIDPAERRNRLLAARRAWEGCLLPSHPRLQRVEALLAGLNEGRRS
jgi:tetratricopeptide (TPR) repeat protein